jgi:hypothetical protein
VLFAPVSLGDNADGRSLGLGWERKLLKTRLNNWPRDEG